MPIKLQNEFFNSEACPFEVHGFFEEIIDQDSGKVLGFRNFAVPDRPLGSDGMKYYVLMEPMSLVKGYKQLPVVVKASPENPRRVIGMIQALCGKQKEKERNESGQETKQTQTDMVSDAETARFIENNSASLGWPDAIAVRDIQDAKPPRYANPKDKEKALRKVFEEAAQCFKGLQAFAAGGDKNALVVMAHLLAENVSWLEGYSYRDKGNLRALATITARWPVMLNQRPAKQRQVRAYLKRIELNPSPKRIRDLALLNIANAGKLQFPKSMTNAPLIAMTDIAARQRLPFLRAHVADGNPLATCLLAALLSESTRWLESGACDGQVLKRVAARCTVWPVMLQCRPRHMRQAVKYLSKVGVGSHAQISPSPKWGTSWHGGEGAVATHYARGVRRAVGSARNFFRDYNGKLERNGPLSRAAWRKIPTWIKVAGKLNALNKQSAPEWGEIGWQLLMEKFDGHPENDVQLRQLGEHRAGRYAREYRRPKRISYRKGEPNLTPHQKAILDRNQSPAGTAAYDIRVAIKSRIVKALTSLAPQN